MNIDDNHNDDDCVFSGMFKFRKVKLQENEFSMTQLLQQTYAGTRYRYKITNKCVKEVVGFIEPY
jgi:hypothetical protein